MSSEIIIDDWFIPADFIGGSLADNAGKRWPDYEEEHSAWCAFVLAVLKLGTQHKPPHRITVCVDTLTEYQIACALRDLSARGWQATRETRSIMSIRSPQPETVEFFFTDGRRATTLLPKTGTIREFMLFLAANEPAFAKAISDNNSFDYAFLVNRIAINTFDNRHKPIRQVMQPGDVVHVVPWRSTEWQCFKFNLLERSHTHDSDCAICLCEFDSPVAGFVVLECTHKFHTVCFSKVKVAECPTCRRTSTLVPFCKKIALRLPVTSKTRAK